MRLLLTLFITLSGALRTQAQGYYSNAGFGFRAPVPAGWKLRSEVRDDGRGSATVAWSLPKIYSESQKALVEDVVSITAHQHDSIRNADDLVRLHFRQSGSTVRSKELLQGTANPTYVVIGEQQKVRYMSRVTFVYRDEFGYVVTFTATPGTYEKNLAAFKSFTSGVQLIPVSQAVKAAAVTAKAAVNLQLDRLYVAKTGTLDVMGTSTEIYTYLRFMADGTVFTQTTNSYDPAGVAKWFGKNGRFERKGVYRISATGISFTVSNAESADRDIDGPRTDVYSGTITDDSRLTLQVTADRELPEQHVFEAVAPSKK